MPKKTRNKTSDAGDFDALIASIERDLRRHRGRRSVGSRSEPHHYKHGPLTHYGVSRKRGKHFGTPGARGKEHIYKRRRYTGDSRGGTTTKLTRPQRARVAKLFALRDELQRGGLMNHKTKTAKAKLLSGLIASLRKGAPLAKKKAGAALTRENINTALFALGGIGGASSTAMLARTLAKRAAVQKITSGE